MAAHKGQNIDFIVATCEDDAGALSRVSAISSAFPRARVIVADSSSDQYKQGSRLYETLQLLGHQAVYVDCDKGCRYSCYQQALQHSSRDYVAFRYNSGKMDEALTALGLSEEFDEDALVTHPGWQTQTGAQQLATRKIEAVVFKRTYLEQQAQLGDSSDDNAEAFFARLADAAQVNTGLVAAA